MPEKIPVEDIPTRKTARKIFKSEKAKERAEQKDYIPLVEAKQTIEVSVKPKLEKKEIETIEPKKRSSKTKKGKLSGNSILIITEKPQAASKISAALSEGRARQLKSGISTYEFKI
jgi:16S rRNA U516 pseudouridylate synthase RsuA-like enzyme